MAGEYLQRLFLLPCQEMLEVQTARSQPYLTVLYRCSISAYGYSTLLLFELLRIWHEPTTQLLQYQIRGESGVSEQAHLQSRDDVGRSTESLTDFKETPTEFSCEATYSVLEIAKVVL